MLLGAKARALALFVANALVLSAKRTTTLPPWRRFLRRSSAFVAFWRERTPTLFWKPTTSNQGRPRRRRKRRPVFEWST